MTMFSIEQRLAGAIDDLEGRLADGQSLSNALDETAAEYGLKTTVLEVRAGRVLGDLATVKARADARLLRAKENIELKQAVLDYVEQDQKCNMQNWLAVRLNRLPSYEELLAAYSRSTELWLNKQVREGNILC